MPSCPALKQTEPASEPRPRAIDDREAREMALFMVRIFGEEAAHVAAERAVKSEQGADWERVGIEIAKLLAADDFPDEGRPLRLFR
jgi:hypothetical protein